MKIVVCRNCGIAMYAQVTSCLKCKLSNLNYYDLYLGDSGIDVEKRIEQLTAPYKKQYASSYFSLFLVSAVALSIAGWHEYTFHPNGYVVSTANSIFELKPKYKVANTTRAKAL